MMAMKWTEKYGWGLRVCLFDKERGYNYKKNILMKIEYYPTSTYTSTSRIGMKCWEWKIMSSPFSQPIGTLMVHDGISFIHFVDECCYVMAWKNYQFSFFCSLSFLMDFIHSKLSACILPVLTVIVFLPNFLIVFKFFFFRLLCIWVGKVYFVACMNFCLPYFRIKTCLWYDKFFENYIYS